MVKQFPILGRYEPLQPPLPFSNTSTRDTTTCPSIEVHVRNHREAPLATTSRPGAQPPTGQPLGIHTPRPQRKSCKAPLTPLLPPLPSSCPLSAHRPSTSAGPGPVCSHGKAAQGSSARMVCNPGIPSGHPEPTLTLHCSLKSPHPRVPAAAGGARAGWGWRGGRRCRGTQAGCLAYSAPPTRAPRQMELASAMGDSLVFPAP